MSHPNSILLSGIVAIEALLLLLPATLYYLGGLLFAILGFIGTNQGGVNPAFLYIAISLLLPGYGLYSLWWLVAKHRTVSARQIPWHIWGGLIVGMLVALLFMLPFVFSWFTPPSQFITHKGNLGIMLIFGGGPFLVALTLLGIMQPC